MNSKCWDKYYWNWKIVAFLDPSYTQFLNKISIETDSSATLVNTSRHNPVDVLLRTANLTEEETKIVQELGLEENTEKEEEKTEPINPNEIIEAVENEEPKRYINRKNNYEGGYPEYELQPLYDTSDPLVCKKRHGRIFNFKFDPKMFPTALTPPKQVLGAGSIMNVGNNTIYNFDAEKTERGRKYPVMIVTKYKFSHTHPHIRLLNAQYRFCQINDCMSDIKNLFRGLTFNYETSNAFLIKNTHSKKGKRFHTELLGLLFNLNNIEILLNSSMPSRLVNKFLTKMYLLVKEKYPQLTISIPTKEEDTNKFSTQHENNTINYAPKRYIINISNQLKVVNENNKSSTLSVIIFVQILLQAKTHNKFDINNYQILKHIQSCLSTELHLNYFNQLDIQKALMIEEVLKSNDKRKKIVKNKKRSDIRRIMKQLKYGDNHNVLKTILKARYQEHYRNIYFKLIHSHFYLHNPIGFINILIHINTVGIKESKHINHLLSSILNDSKMSSNTQKQAIDSLANVLNYIQQTTSYITDKNRYYITGKYVVRAYIKIIRKIIFNNNPLTNNKIPRWHRWNDMYNMANELGIRIRPNKFKNAEHVDYLHDKLSEYFQRDQLVSSSLDRFHFLKFESPSHSYKINDKEFWFVQLKTANELIREGREMHHCVGSYGERCAMGDSIIFSMTDGNRSYVTIELNEYLSIYKLGQVYTLNDNVIRNNKVNDTIDEWYKECIDIHKQDKISYKTLSINRYKQYKLNRKLDNMKETILKYAREDSLLKYAREDSLITKEYYNDRIQKTEDELKKLQETIKTQTELYNTVKEVK